MAHHHHNNALVFLSIVIAIFASYTALDLANSISLAKGKVLLLWLSAGSIAMGVGIWSMHFIGMLALSMPGLPIAYDVPLLILSIVVAVLASALTLILVSRNDTSVKTYLAGSLTMGAAIAGMHYIGIWSMRMPAMIIWNYNYVVASIIIAVVASFVALLLAFKLKDDLGPKGFLYRGAGGVLMGFAISGMHYTGMGGMTFSPTESSPLLAEQLLATNGLAAAVIVGTLVILGIALTGSNIDRALSRRTSMNEALTKAIKARDEFLSIASHELKTPLTSIKLQTQMIAKSLHKENYDPERMDRMLKQTDQSVNRITRLVDDMLDISRLATGKMTLQKEFFLLEEMVRDVIERLQPLMDEASCTVSFKVLQPASGNWDKFRLEQVVTNILTNATRYSPGTLIEIKLGTEDNMAVISFKDSGCGIHPADQERIFLRYERAESAHETRAMGLGLYIVKQILNMHGGDIRVKSELNKGSEFIITLPTDHTATQEISTEQVV